MADPSGYPANWQAEYPGPYPLGMPIWLDSWGPPPPLVHYGNGTTNPGPQLPIYAIASATWAGKPAEPINLSALLAPRPVTPQPPPPPPPPPPNERPTYPKLGLIDTWHTTAPSANSWVSEIVDGALDLVGTTLNLVPNMANPYTFQSSLTNQLTAGGVVGSLVGADACSALPASYQAACRIALGLAGAVVTGSGNTNSSTNTSTCPPGYINVAGRCVAPQNALPGGQPLTLTRNQPTTGGLGLTAVTPTQVGTITRNDGTTGPILRCPRKYVLGQDYLCYPKQMIPNNLRAHPRGTRPLLTGGEVKVLRKAKGLERKVTKLGRQFGKKACHCKSTTTRRKK